MPKINAQNFQQLSCQRNKYNSECRFSFQLTNSRKLCYLCNLMNSTTLVAATPIDELDPKEFIIIKGARVNNLKSIPGCKKFDQFVPKIAPPPVPFPYMTESPIFKTSYPASFHHPRHLSCMPHSSDLRPIGLGMADCRLSSIGSATTTTTKIIRN